MAKQTKREYIVYVDSTADPKRWSYTLMARTPGEAVERILVHMGWQRLMEPGFTFVTSVVELPF